LRPAILFPFFAELTTLPGIGSKVEKVLAKLIAGKTWVDLLFHLPHAVIDRRFMPLLSAAPSGTVITTKIRVGEHTVPKGRHNRSPYRVVCHNDSGEITLLFFRHYGDYLKKQLPEGTIRVVSGRVDRQYGTLQMAHPDYMLTEAEAQKMLGIEPVYPMTAGIGPKTLTSAVSHMLGKLPVLPEWIDQAMVKTMRWHGFKECLHALHQPKEVNAIDVNGVDYRRLAYDELLANQLSLALSRTHIKRSGGQVITGSGTLTAQLRKTLPFTLTTGQEAVLLDIVRDQASQYRMFRLLQGDVGSGKTVVALLAMLQAVEVGKQAVFMAPTALLAEQQYQWCQQVLEGMDVTVVLLTRHVKGKAKKACLEAIAKEEADIIIGTHAIIQEGVKIPKLALAVIDEQHRFGVDQRLSLAAKGQHVDMLLMSATPIPRTLQLTAYGDMDCSFLTMKPHGRKPIKTVALANSKINNVVKRLFAAIAAGNKAYWICPLIEESEKSDLAAAEERFAYFQKKLGEKVALIHSKIPNEERDHVMRRFKAGEVQLLIATTVVEVGVDVPDATIMVIEHAERFGLSQLHQLRGRVGRGIDASSCVLLYEALSHEGMSRLSTLCKTEDGFKIAEADLRIRGGGDILGTRQSGLPTFRIALLPEHGDLLQMASQEAKKMLQEDPMLTSERGDALKLLLHLFRFEEQAKYLQVG